MKGQINLVRPVCHTDDEDILLQIHAIHFHQDLVEDIITSTSSMGFYNGVQLIDKHDIRGCSTGFVKDIMDVGLWFTEMHYEKLGALRVIDQ